MDFLQYSVLVGTGGIGSGIFFELKGNQTLGRNESREGFLLNSFDFCKLHIITHYVAMLLGAGAQAGSPFKIFPVGKIGPDNTGESLVGMMQKVGMDTRFVERDENATTLFSVCFQYPDSSGGNITTATSASNRVAPEDIRKAKPIFEEYRGKGMVLAAPEVPLESRLTLLKMGAEYDFLCFATLNSAEIIHFSAPEFFRNTDVLVLNRDEAESLLKASFSPKRPTVFLKLLEEMLAGLNPDLRICLTLGKDGAYGYEKGSWEFIPCASVEAKSTAGAGDAATSGLIIAMAAGLPFILPRRKKRKALNEAKLETAMDFATLLASYSVLSTDTINLATTRERVYEHGKKLWLVFSEKIERILTEVKA